MTDCRPLSTAPARQKVVEHLAELTGIRNRDILDVLLVAALRTLLQPNGVAIHRCVGQFVQQRWLMRARLYVGDAAVTAEPLGNELDSLPALAAVADRFACMQSQQPMMLLPAPAAGRSAVPVDHRP